MIKNIDYRILVIFIFAFTANILISQDPCSARNTSVQMDPVQENEPPSLNVTGTGISKTNADTVNLTVTVESKNVSADDASSTNASISQKVTDALKSNGIQDKDIQTSGFNIFPDYEYDDTQKKSILVGYVVTNTLDITVRKISEVGNIIDLVVSKSDKNEKNTISVGSVRFSLEDIDSSLTESLQKAVQDARKKANIVANAANKNITGVKNIIITSDSSFKEPEPKLGSAFDGGGAGVSTNIQPREISVSSSVSITYTLDK